MSQAISRLFLPQHDENKETVESVRGFGLRNVCRNLKFVQ